MVVDVNGTTPPNRMGIDIHNFLFTQDRIIPGGADTAGLGIIQPPNGFPEKCNRHLKDRENGLGCTAWVLYNKNLDYLHCDNLSWNGKKSCKN